MCEQRGASVESLSPLLIPLRAPLVSWAMRLAGTRESAEDLVQEAMERALLHSARFRPGTNLGAWLRVIIRNVFIDQCRRRRLAMRHVGGGDAPHVDEDRGPLDVIYGYEVEEAVRALPKQDREILELACLDRRSYKEIGRELGIGTQTVGSRLSRAKARLRHVLSRLVAERTGTVGRATPPGGSSQGALAR